MTQQQRIAWACVGVGLLFLGHTLFKLLNRYRGPMETVEGTVSSCERLPLDISTYQQFLVHINFQYRGTVHRTLDPWRKGSPTPIGTKVPLMFPAGRPEEAVPKRGDEIWAALMLGFAMLGAGAAVLLGLV